MQTLQKIQPTIVYSPGYDICFPELEHLHPFDTCKYSRAWNELGKRFGSVLERWHIAPEHSATLSELASVHTQDYLKLLQDSKYLAKALEVPQIALLPIKTIDSVILEPMRLATSGTIIAAQTALSNGIAVNLSGGYHHASQDRGEGFCIYSDIAIAIAQLRQANQIKPGETVAIIDLDAHQGNGLERIFLENKDVCIFDMYNRDIYPQDHLAVQRIDCALPLPSSTGNRDYLAQLKASLPAFLNRIAPVKLAFYNAGTDIYEHDPLGQLKVSQNGVLDRDKFVFETLVSANIPFVMVLSGGYTRESYLLVANSVCYLLETWAKG